MAWSLTTTLVACGLWGACIAQPDNRETGAAHGATSSGTLRGNLLLHAKEFLGIPYATHKRRFDAAVDWPVAKPYAATPFDATYYGPPCLQYFSSNETWGVEECYVINVWHPRNATVDSQLPVLVFIYGGSWDFDDTSSYNASELAANQNVVVASFNYRVGPLGFASFAEQPAAGVTTGNFGMLDMQSALRWVQREIHHFGGDRARVGLFGQSSGGEAVEVLTIAPSSKGLFIGSVSQSGGMEARPLADAVAATRILAAQVNCTGAAILECMRAADPLQIVFKQNQSQPGPVTDGVFLPRDPQAMLRNGELLDVGVLWGANTNDSFMDILQNHTDDNGAIAHVGPKEYREALSRRFHGNATVTTQVLEWYPPSARGNNLWSIGWSASDAMLCGQRKNLRTVAAANPHRRSGQWMYRYNHWFQSNKTCTTQSNYHRPEFGSMHQDEVSFVFGQPIFMFTGYTNCSVPGWDGFDPGCLGCVYNDDEARFARRVGQYWANMAASGNPNRRDPALASTDSFTEDAWPSFGPEHDVNIVLEPMKDGAPFELESHLGDRHCDFWDSLQIH